MTLKQRRGTFKRSIATLEQFVHRLDDPAPPTDTEVNLRLVKLDKEFNEFQTVQTEIEAACTNEEDEEAEYKQRELLEEKMIAVKVAFQRFLEKTPQPQPQTQSDNAALAKISEVLERLSNQGQTSSSDTFKIPAVAVPEFNGDYKHWSSFHDLFSSLIHNNPKLTPSQKLQHLKGALKGEAASSLQQFNVSDANYEPAWEELKRRFDKKSLIVQSHIRAIIEQPAITNFSPNKFAKINQHNIRSSLRPQRTGCNCYLGQHSDLHNLEQVGHRLQTTLGKKNSIHRRTCLRHATHISG
jgi:Protein of unknown function (DUF1759)